MNKEQNYQMTTEASNDSNTVLPAVLKFGDYCAIEQHRYGGNNEHYIHKVIGTSRSNKWVDVPVMHNATETIHDHMEDVVSCICCGVCETEVLKYRLGSIKVPIGK